MESLPIEIPSAQLAAFCRAHRVRRLALFGSVLREDFRPDSDIDVLAEFEPQAKVGMIALAGMELELGAMLGRRVDLNTSGFLSPHFAEAVRREALPIYVAA